MKSPIILSRKKARELVSENPGFFNVICITEQELDQGAKAWVPVPEEIVQHAKDHLWLRFNDWKINAEGSPHPEDVKKALDWAEGKDNIIVTCFAGISRSSAIAYLIECSRAYHPRLATAILVPLKHNPNMRIVKQGAEILKDGRILDEIYTWLDKPCW